MPSSPPAAVKLIRVVVAFCGRSTSLPVRTVTLTGVGWGVWRHRRGRLHMTCGKRPEAASSHKAGEVRSLIPLLWVLGRNCLPFCLHCIKKKGERPARLTPGRSISRSQANARPWPWSRSSRADRLEL